VFLLLVFSLTLRKLHFRFKSISSLKLLSFCSFETCRELSVRLFECAVKFDGSGFKSCSRYALRVKIYLFSKSHKFIARYIFSSLFHGFGIPFSRLFFTQIQIISFSKRDLLQVNSTNKAENSSFSILNRFSPLYFQCHFKSFFLRLFL
jgi:hypothetical protein